MSGYFTLIKYEKWGYDGSSDIAAGIKNLNWNLTKLKIECYIYNKNIRIGVI
jgi:hypothetical protein